MFRNAAALGLEPLGIRVLFLRQVIPHALQRRRALPAGGGGLGSARDGPGLARPHDGRGGLGRGLVAERRPAVDEADEEEQHTDKQVEPERRHLRGALAGVELGGEPARAEQQRDEVAEELCVEVKEVLQRLVEHVAERLAGVEIVLAAVVAVGSLQSGAAVLTVRVLSGGGGVAHAADWNSFREKEKRRIPGRVIRLPAAGPVFSAGAGVGG